MGQDHPGVAPVKLDAGIEVPDMQREVCKCGSHSEQPFFPVGRNAVTPLRDVPRYSLVEDLPRVSSTGPLRDGVSPQVKLQ
jgi:hypothetical protein